MKPSEKERLIAELKQQFHEEGQCPVCNQKKRPAFTEERKAQLSTAMKNTPRKRVSPTTTKILVKIKEAGREFLMTEIVKSTKTSINTVREIVRRLVKAGELRSSDTGDERVKTVSFGKSEFWKELEREGNIALKSLPE